MATRRAYLLLLSTLLLAAAARRNRARLGNAQRGYIQPAQEMAVIMGGNAVQLAPGGIIRTRKISSSFRRRSRGGVWVDYVLDKNGL